MTNDWHQACHQTMTMAREAIAWINDAENAKTVGLERKALDRRLRTMVTELTKLDRSVDRPMSVSVFGPSQAGKSYLSSVLAGQGERPLMARFSGEAEDYDFLATINPAGDRESTGVVTRFSLHSVPAPAGYPVCLRLLTEIEVAKILGNSYFLDGNPKLLAPLSSENLSTALTTARGRASKQGQPADNRLTVEDIWDLQSYFEHTFEGSRQIEALKGFWDEAAALAPQLSIADRAELFSLLWGKLPEFTELYRKLIDALSRIDFATEAYCPMSALIPREESIIDVITLTGIGKDESRTLEIRSFNGAPVSLPRQIITALIAELRITITESPWPFFAHTDLLDFPGARSRQPIDLANELKNEDRDQLKESILRGKVAYLFERYVAEQELTSMLLCVKPSNQDVATLPDMINDWLAVSHGASPADRIGKTVVVFLVLTLFDLHFMQNAGEGTADPGVRFKSRIFSSIENFFGKAHDWPMKWTPEAAFSNTFWLRNPTIKSEFLVEYENGREARIRPDKEAYVAGLREGYLGVEGVQRHFEDPGRAFDEALKLNDGGVSYLVEKLSPVCRPGLKEEQIAGRLAALRSELHTKLAPFHVDNDVEKRLEERRAVSQRILMQVQLLAQQRRFADLIAALQLTEENVSRVIYEAYSRRATVIGGGSDKAENPKPVVAPVPSPMAGLPPLPGMPPLPGQAAAPSAPAAPTAPAPRMDSVEMYLARALVEHWIGALYSGAETDHLLQFFRSDPKLALELVNELSTAARRLRLDEQLGSAIARLSGSLNEEINLYLEKATFASCAIVNRFVNEFGYDKLAPQDRPQAPGPAPDHAPRPVFRPREGANSASQIDIAPPQHQYEHLADWMYGLHDTIERNAKSVDGLAINLEQNTIIGKIVDGLRDGAGSLPGRS